MQFNRGNFHAQNLRRRVVAAGGAASDYMRPDADVAIVPDGKGWDGDMEEAAAENPSLRYVFHYIYE